MDVNINRLMQYEQLTFDLPKCLHMLIESTEPAAVYEVNSDGEIVAVLGTAMPNRPFRINNHKERKIYVQTADGQPWMPTFTEIPDAMEINNDPPVAAAVELPEPTLQERLRKMVIAQMAHLYGETSDEVDTIEDAMDFDMPGASEPLSGFEDMVEEDLIVAEETPAATPDTPAEPTADQPAADAPPA